jgi:hypothetical protein
MQPSIYNVTKGFQAKPDRKENNNQNNDINHYANPNARTGILPNVRRELFAYRNIRLKSPNQTLTTSDNESETQGIQDNSYWIMFENDLTPPSLLIKRNKISIYAKSIRNVQGLNFSLLSSFKTNFLHKEIKQIEQEWSFTIEDLLLNYKGENKN